MNDSLWTLIAASSFTNLFTEHCKPAVMGKNQYIKKFKKINIICRAPGVPIMAQQLNNLTCIHEDTDSNPGKAQWDKHLALP